MKGIVPAVAILAILAAAGVGIGTPMALAEMQHRNITKFTPEDLPYGIMRAGENLMGMYQFNKTQWNGELIRTRGMEKTELQKKCPNCAQQIQQLVQEQTMLGAEQEAETKAENKNQGNAQPWNGGEKPPSPPG
jgi:hypothetical protein